jgi:hypothetical protein
VGTAQELFKTIMLINLENDSKYQEQIIEYKFLSDLMVSLASSGKKLEVLRQHTDSFGYDLLLKVGNIIKYVQLKSRKLSGRAQCWDVHKSLLKDPKGFVLIIFYEFKNKNLFLKYYYLNYKKYKETRNTIPKYKKDTNKYCRVSKKNLLPIESINKLVKELF